MLPLPPRRERPPVALTISTVERHLREVDAVAGDVSPQPAASAVFPAQTTNTLYPPRLSTSSPPHRPVRHLLERVHAHLLHLRRLARRAAVSRVRHEQQPLAGDHQAGPEVPALERGGFREAGGG
uniref:Uncharacterized protein n=1 Tax=Setaria italica TaxID=4555 RepID=K3XN74_SETIT